MHFTNIVPNILDICQIRTKCHSENMSFQTPANTSSDSANFTTNKRDTESSSCNVLRQENGSRTRFATRLNATSYSGQTTGTVVDTHCTVRCSFVVCVQTEVTQSVRCFLHVSSPPLWRARSVYTNSVRVLCPAVASCYTSCSFRSS